MDILQGSPVPLAEIEVHATTNFVTVVDGSTSKGWGELGHNQTKDVQKSEGQTLQMIMKLQGMGLFRSRLWYTVRLATPLWLVLHPTTREDTLVNHPR